MEEEKDLNGGNGSNLNQENLIQDSWQQTNTSKSNTEEITNIISNETSEKERINKEEAIPQYEEVKPQYDEVEIKQKHNLNDSYFDGKLFELIGYRILHFIISVVSLGIASPWSSCMLLSYRINHTVYNGKRLKFEGTGGSLFGLRLKWFFLTLITFGIYLFFKPVSKLKWIMSNVHFEDETLIKGESYFSGNTFGLILVNVLCKIINLLTLGLLTPFTYCYKHKWIVKHTIINRKRITFNGKAIDLFLHKLLWNFLTIITLGIFGFWHYIAESKWLTKRTHIKIQGEEEEKDNSLFIGVVIGVVVLSILAVVIPVIIVTKNTLPDYNYVNEIQNTLKEETKDEIMEIYKSNEYEVGKKYKLNSLDSLNKYDNVKGYYIIGGSCEFDNEGWPMIGEYYKEEYARPEYASCEINNLTTYHASVLFKSRDYRVILSLNLYNGNSKTEWIYVNDKYISNMIGYVKSVIIGSFEDLQ